MIERGSHARLWGRIVPPAAYLLLAACPDQRSPDRLGQSGAVYLIVNTDRLRDSQRAELASRSDELRLAYRDGAPAIYEFISP
jgi:hypothetical protein